MGSIPELLLPNNSVMSCDPVSPAPMIATRFFDDFAEDPLVADEDFSLSIRRPRRIKMTIPKLRTKSIRRTPLGGNKACGFVRKKVAKNNKMEGDPTDIWTLNKSGMLK